MKWISLILILPLCLSCAATRQVTAPPPEADTCWLTPEREALPVTTPAPKPIVGSAEKVIPYAAGEVTVVQVPVKYGVTLALPPGEKFVDVFGGDRPLKQPGETIPPWDISRSMQDDSVFIQVSQPGLKMGLTVTTTAQRRLLLDLRSVASSRIRLVRWSAPAPAQPVAASSSLPDVAKPAIYYRGYITDPETGGPYWTPIHIMHNGRKTFVTFPTNIRAMTFPLVRLMGPNGPEVVNTRLIDHVLVIDHVVDRLELRVGVGKTAEVVTITRGAAVALTCPGDDACPTWSAHAILRNT